MISIVDCSVKRAEPALRHKHDRDGV